MKSKTASARVSTSEHTQRHLVLMTLTLGLLRQQLPFRFAERHVVSTALRPSVTMTMTHGLVQMNP